MQKDSPWTVRQEYYPPKPSDENIPDAQGSRDRARVIHSSAFRRLQNKTQILGVGSDDFYRTRLTHSLEVAQIGSGIADLLRGNVGDNDEVKNLIPAWSQIEAICLAHDIGHPPFGHSGEVVLGKHMKGYGGFEGNGQTLRIVACLGEYTNGCGMNLTRRTLLGLLKYPAIHKKVINHDIEYRKSPKCIHDDEEELLDWILSPLCDKDKSEFQRIKQVQDQHSKTIYKSFDATIMELADDIAYGVHDLEDAIELDLVSRDKWETFVEMVDGELKSILKKNPSFFKGKIERKKGIGKLVNYFISNIQIQMNAYFSEPLLKYKAEMACPAKCDLDKLKKFISENVIKSPEVEILGHKGQYLVERLFEAFTDSPSKLLPVHEREKYKNFSDCKQKQQRLICDYICGMTDTYAARVYQQLFLPSSGAIFGRI